jgi:SNF2 family DNA or RNA helicase
MINDQNKVDQKIQKNLKIYDIILNRTNYTYNQYQYKGIEWCLQNELAINPFHNCRGGFIADEMGLGKTLLMIATIFGNIVEKTLIIVPPILIQQWNKEIIKISAHRSIIFYGKEKKDITIENLNNARIVISSYNALLQKDCKLLRVNWDRVIFDEAHHIRNKKTKIYISCALLKRNICWLVTGTPIQNKKNDFYNLCSILGLGASYYSNSNNYEEIIKKFVLRRTKIGVGIEMPGISIYQCKVSWINEKEKKLAEEIHSLLQSQTGVGIEKRHELAPVLERGGILVSLLRARQVCILSNLMRKPMEYYIKAEYIPKAYLETLNYSSKMEALFKIMVEKKDNGKGKLVFCHFREEIDYIRDKLIEKGFKEVVVYDGRKEINIGDIEKVTGVLIMQIQTGCEGLNLQKNFSEIYFVSPHWNPFIEDQAIARCYRIGQKNEVDVYKLEMDEFGKIMEEEEERMIALDGYAMMKQEGKRLISKEILNI